MRTLGRKMAREWEKTFFWVTMLIFTGVLASWLARYGGDHGPPPFGVAPQPHPSWLSRGALAFLAPSATNDIPRTDPFDYTFTGGRKRPKQRPWNKPKLTRKGPKKPNIRRPIKRKPGPPKPVVTTAETPDPPKPVPVAPTVPKKPPEVRIVEYLGIIKTASGKQAAYVKTGDPKTQESRIAFLTEGAKANGVEVQGFSAESLEVLDAGGKTSRIAFREEKKIVIE